MNTLQYKGYVGSLEFSEEDNIFFGKVMGIRSLISYEGETAKDLIEDFHGAIDDYLTMCTEEGIEPEKAYKGAFNVRISPELHKQIVILAAQKNISLNQYVSDALEESVLIN